MEINEEMGKTESSAAAVEDSKKKEIMDLLHEYNEIKDAAQVVIGCIANIEKTTVKEIHQRLNLPLDS